MKIIWAQGALDQLTVIEDYISKDSPERALKFIEILTVFEGLGLLRIDRIDS